MFVNSIAIEIKAVIILKMLLKIILKVVNLVLK